MSDDRVLENFVDASGKLLALPAQRKKRLVVLRWLVEDFQPGRLYPESEVNRILARRHPDFWMLRRYLVDEELMQRRAAVYWRTGSVPNVGIDPPPIRQVPRELGRVTRILRSVGMFLPPIAALTVVTAGSLTPGYDPVARTVSRLAVPGLPAAVATDVAIGIVGVACVAVALTIGGDNRVGRAALIAAGVGFLLAAVWHLDPPSAATTAMHRAASGLAMLGLTIAPLVLWRHYGRALLVLGGAEVAMLVIALALLPTSFNAWGAWERVVLVLGLSCLVAVAIRTIPSSDDAASVRAASQSSAGTKTPVASVKNANP